MELEGDVAHCEAHWLVEEITIAKMTVAGNG